MSVSFKESTLETSFDYSSIPCSNTRHENPEFIESCPAVLQPSKIEFHFEDETTRSPMVIFSALPPLTPAFVPALVGSASVKSFHLVAAAQVNTEEQRGKKVNCSAAVFNCYRKYAIAFRNSRFFYVVQFLLCLLPLSAVAMGIKFSDNCRSSFPVLTSIIGIVGTLFFGVWISINVFHHFGRRCTGQQKFLVRMLFGLLTLLLSIEMSLFFTKSVSFNPTDRSYCSKTFIDYTFYKYVTIGGSLLFALILYIPDFRSYICSFECSMPIGRVLYDQI